MSTTTFVPATLATEPTPAPVKSGPIRTLRHGLTLGWRSILQTRHNPEKLIDVLLTPIIFLVLFLYVFGGAVSGSTDAYLQELLPGLVAQLVMFASIGIGITLSDDIHKGIFDRFRSLPISRSAPLIGAVLGDSIRFVISIGILIGFGSLLGFRFHGSILGILAALLLGYVFGLALSWLSAVIGLLAKNPQVVQGVSFLWVMPFTFGSSALIADTNTMPGWLQAWVNVNPISHLADACRGLMVGGPVANNVLITLGWAAGLFATLFPLATWLYRRSV